MSKYEKWYSIIVDSAKTRTITEYTETHHILPRSLGGTDDSTNLVKLTAREHFVCHWLLTKIHTGLSRGKMINAMYMMQGQSAHQKRYKTKITARIYEKLRREYSDYISKLNTGRVQPPEEKAKQIAAITGRTRASFSDEWKQNLSKNHKSKRGFDCSISEETRKKISEAMSGKKQKPEVVANRAAKIKGIPKPKKLCPHCNKEIAVNGYARWHGDNCKLKGTVNEK